MCKARWILTSLTPLCKVLSLLSTSCRPLGHNSIFNIALSISVNSLSLLLHNFEDTHYFCIQFPRQRGFQKQFMYKWMTKQPISQSTWPNRRSTKLFKLSVLKTEFIISQVPTFCSFVLIHTSVNGFIIVFSLPMYVETVSIIWKLFLNDLVNLIYKLYGSGGYCRGRF